MPEPERTGTDKMGGSLRPAPRPAEGVSAKLHGRLHSVLPNY